MENKEELKQEDLEAVNGGAMKINGSDELDTAIMDRARLSNADNEAPINTTIKFK